MDEFEKVFERLKAISNTSTQAELADVLHIRQSSISDAKRRNSVPSDWLIKFFDLFGANPDYLRYGSKPVFLKKNGQYKCIQDIQSPIFKVRRSKLARGVVKSYFSGIVNDADAPSLTGVISLPEEFASDKIMVLMASDSVMAPVIRKDSFVGINTKMKHTESGEIYAVNLPYEGIVPRRAYFDPLGEEIRLCADDARYPLISIPPCEFQARVLGKVEWVLQYI